MVQRLKWHIRFSFGLDLISHEDNRENDLVKRNQFKKSFFRLKLRQIAIFDTVLRMLLLDLQIYEMLIPVFGHKIAIIFWHFANFLLLSFCSYSQTLSHVHRACVSNFLSEFCVFKQIYQPIR